MVVNRVLPELFTRADEVAFEALRQPAVVGAVEGVVGPGIGDVLDRRRPGGHPPADPGRPPGPASGRPSSCPPLYLPELFIRAQGMRVTRMVADSLGEELGL